MAPSRSSRKADKPDNFIGTAHRHLSEHKEKKKRSKGGCITCRLRGKRCDLSIPHTREDSPQSCATCTRLRLPCLGFQDKRPEWLKDKDTLKVVKDKIKAFLYSQGLIKGQTGCGVRPPDFKPRWLTEEELKGSSSPTQTPPPPSPSASARTSLSFSEEEDTDIKYSPSLRHGAQQEQREDTEGTDSPQSVMTDTFPAYVQSTMVSGGLFVSLPTNNAAFSPSTIIPPGYEPTDWADETMMVSPYGDGQGLTMSPAYHTLLPNYPAHLVGDCPLNEQYFHHYRHVVIKQ